MRKITKYLSEVRAEFKNIAWPKKDTLLQLTVVVIAISLFISALLGGFDYLFTNSFAYLTTFKTQPQVQVVTPAPQISPAVSATPSMSVSATPSPKTKK